MKLLKGHGEDHAREWAPDAVMSANPEGDMWLRGAAQVELVGVLEDLTVTICTENGREDVIANSKVNASQDGIPHDNPPRRLRRVQP